jgi:hypothetical protein
VNARGVGYDSASLDERTLVLVPVSVRDIGDPGDFRRVFGPDAGSPSPESALQRLFSEAADTLADHVYLAVEKAAGQSTADYLEFNPSPMETDSNRLFSLRFPSHLLPLRDGSRPDLCLRLADIGIRRIDGVVPSDGGGLSGVPINQLSPSPGAFSMRGSYLIWDYAKNAHVAYGRFESSVRFYNGQVSRATWEAVVAQSMGNIVKQSPLYGMKMQAVEARTGNTHPTYFRSRPFDPLPPVPDSHLR